MLLQKISVWLQDVGLSHFQWTFPLPICKMAWGVQRQNMDLGAATGVVLAWSWRPNPISHSSSVPVFDHCTRVNWLVTATPDLLAYCCLSSLTLIYHLWRPTLASSKLWLKWGHSQGANSKNQKQQTAPVLSSLLMHFLNTGIPMQTWGTVDILKTPGVASTVLHTDLWLIETYALETMSLWFCGAKSALLHNFAGQRKKDL